jgi:hypothetical protein
VFAVLWDARAFTPNVLNPGFARTGGFLSVNCGFGRIDTDRPMIARFWSGSCAERFRGRHQGNVAVVTPVP